MKAKFSIHKLTMSKPVVGGLLAFSLALGIAFGPGLPGFASISQDDRLAKLEVKFFKHTYLKDDDAARLDRLEKMIFGEARTGSDDERLKNLAATVPNLSELPADAEGPAPAPAKASQDPTAGSSGAADPYPAEDGSQKVSNHSSGKRGGRKGAAGNSSAGSGSGASATAGGASGGSSSGGSTETASGGGSAGANGSGRGSTASGSGRSSASDDEELGAHHVLAGESKYPAVTALEQHLFNRDYASDAVGDRLNRLETKVFGKPSRFTDLSERVDALKEKTNIDIAKRPPAGTDWTDDDEDNGQAFPVPKHSEPVARADGDDGRSFSGRDVGSDLRKAFGIGAGGYAGGQSSGSYGMSGTSAGRSGGNSASGAYGMGGTNSGASASYGSGGGSNDRTSNLAMMGGSGAMSGGSNSVSGGSGALSGAKKRPAKAAAPAPDDDNAPPPSNPLGLNQQVSNLESAVLGKTFTQDPLRDRVDRLEKSVFPKETPSDLALPARVARLVQKVPVASQQAVSSAGRSSRGGGDPSSFSSAGASGAARKRPSGWIDEDANLGYGGGSRGSSAGASSDDDDSYGGTGLGSITGLGAGMGGSMGSGMASGMGAGMGSGMAAGTPQQTVQKPGGLSKIINSIGNALGGGFTGGYNVNSGMHTDPATGMLVDNMTGNLINPTTGAVVGRSAAYSGAPMYSGMQTGGIGGLGGIGGIGLGGMPMGGVGLGGMPMGGVGIGGLGGGMPYGGMPYGGMPYGGMPYGGMPYGGLNGFNNGFAGSGLNTMPFGGMRYGGMGSGVRIGF